MFDNGFADYDEPWLKVHSTFVIQSDRTNAHDAFEIDKDNYVKFTNWYDLEFWSANWVIFFTQHGNVITKWLNTTQITILLMLVH